MLELKVTSIPFPSSPVLVVINTTPLPAKVYANEGIAQIIFLGADEVCRVSYWDKKGKYQAQKNITLPKTM